MYNFALAFVLCAAVYIIGEVVSTATKAWIPSVFVTAAIILVGYWTVLPTTLISDAVLIPFGSTIGIYLLITHMGTVISIKQLLEQWKTIVVCLAGLAGMCVLALFVCPLLMDRSFVVAGLPPLTGGIVAATTMMEAANAAGLKEAAVFAIAMYCVQGFAGYPLQADCLQLEGKKLLKIPERLCVGCRRFNAVDATRKAGNHRELAQETAAPHACQVEFCCGDAGQAGIRGLAGHTAGKSCHPRPEHDDQRRCVCSWFWALFSPALVFWMRTH